MQKKKFYIDFPQIVTKQLMELLKIEWKYLCKEIILFLIYLGIYFLADNGQMLEEKLWYWWQKDRRILTILLTTFFKAAKLGLVYILSWKLKLKLTFVHKPVNCTHILISNLNEILRDSYSNSLYTVKVELHLL